MSRSGNLQVYFDEPIISLNPSFSGCPALGKLFLELEIAHNKVLIPLLVDVPLWEFRLINGYIAKDGS